MLQAKAGGREMKIAMGVNPKVAADYLLSIAYKMARKAYPALLQGLQVNSDRLKLASLTLLTTKTVDSKDVELLNANKDSITLRQKTVDVSWLKNIEFRVINDIVDLVPQASQGFYRGSF